MPAQYDPKSRYNVVDPDGLKVGEVVKGVLYEGAPDYREKVGTIAFDAVDDRLIFVHHNVVFELVPQEQP
ncbi:hypothetical protein [Pseudomonas brassicacearum]|uniref:Uncharacterized protein n=1 Tax=Pseudomonas brassicacearum TaxID=930166 RepID=A0A423JVT8_9PSED|nr:hypothetical protein [Pseudomonas brassicacearum]RON41774.1 hypothetical protein BK664_04280 [Pseudomonas brassicacearum]